MAAEKNAPQNFENHVRSDPKITVTSLLYLLALILAIVGMFTPAWVTQISLMVLIVAALLTALMARLYSTTLQDRIIMLEMRLRLAEVLSGDLAARVPELSRAQLVALRFASDAELPELTRKTLDENLSPAKEIKKLVTDWQADHHRV